MGVINKEKTEEELVKLQKMVKAFNRCFESWSKDNPEIGVNFGYAYTKDKIKKLKVMSCDITLYQATPSVGEQQGKFEALAESNMEVESKAP